MHTAHAACIQVYFTASTCHYDHESLRAKLIIVLTIYSIMAEVWIARMLYRYEQRRRMFTSFKTSSLNMTYRRCIPTVRNRQRIFSVLSQKIAIMKRSLANNARLLLFICQSRKIGLSGIYSHIFFCVKLYCYDEKQRARRSGFKFSRATNR
jgi:hypothetical protein